MLTNIKIVTEACNALNISYEILHPAQGLIRIKLDKYYYFVNQKTPFNSQAIAQICKDKEYTYQLLKEKIPIPRLQGFISPFCSEKYQRYINLKSLEEIVSAIIQQFSLPVILKKNQGWAGINVFLCKDAEELQKALERIYDKNSRDYDYIALAQDYLPICREYRAIFFKQELVLLYEKDKSKANFVGNLSPLHQEGSKAIPINDSTLISTLETFVQPVFQEIEINYAGFDIAQDDNGDYWLIEINSCPGYDFFVRDNGETIVVEMFKKILSEFSQSPVNC